MLSLDLFDSRYEKRLHEGAVDDAEYARLKKLGQQIDYLKQARAKTKDADMHRAIDQRIQKYDDERHEILSVRGMNEVEQMPSQSAQSIPKGIGDIQDPKTKMAQLAQKAKKGPLANVGAGLKGFLTGKEEPVDEQENPVSPVLTMSQQAVAELIKAWEGELDYIEVPLIDGSSVPITRPALFNTLVALKQQQTQRPKKYNEYIDKVFATKDGFMRWLANVPRFQTPAKKKKMQAQMGLDLQPPPLQEPGQATQATPAAPAGPMVDPEFRKQAGLSERKSQKKKFRSAVAQREIEKAMTAYPTARDSIEAFVLKSLDTDDRQDRVLKDLEQDIDQVKSGQAPVAATPVMAPAKQVATTPTKITAPVAPTPTTARAQPAPMPTTLPVPAPEPEAEPTKVKKPRAKKADTTVITVKKPRVRKLPAKDMGQAIEIPVSGQEAPALAAPDADFGDLQSLLGQSAGKQAEKIIQTAKQSSKSQPAEIEEHGGGIGPRQHWQSLMRETGRPPMDTLNYYFPDINAQSDVEAIRAAIREIVKNPQLSQTSKARMLRDIDMMVRRNRLLIGREWRQYLDRVSESDEHLVEGIRDTASATAVIACLLAGGSLQGCATAPQQTTTAQAVKTGQDVGRIIYNAKNITRAGTEEEARQELKNILRGMTTRPQELNNSNIMRIWRRVNQPNQETPQNEAVTKEPRTKQELLDMIDKIQRMSAQERNPANLQIMRKDIELLKQKYSHLKEDTAALAAEDAILKRIFVRHRDLMMEYGPEKITQAAEEVAYNVGDIAHISDEQIQEWVGQVEYILGAKP